MGHTSAPPIQTPSTRFIEETNHILTEICSTLTTRPNQETQALLEHKEDIHSQSKELHGSRYGRLSEVHYGEKVVINL